MNIPQVQGNNKNIWYLQFEGSEFGPLSIHEALIVVKSGKLQGTLYGWTPGFKSWKPIVEIPELVELKTQLMRSGAAGDTSTNRRSSSRAALLAVVRYDDPNQNLENGAGIYGGICKDISEGGIQILGNDLIGGLGSLIHMEITPVNNEFIRPFEALGRIRNILPNGQGFGVQFRTLLNATRKEIQAYLESPSRSVE